MRVQSTITWETDAVLESGINVVECKGLGHPDTLADHLAEALSRRYAAYTLDTCGAVLHHNFDKLALLGGASHVTYGGGHMASPVRVLVNGRISRTFAGKRLPVESLIGEVVDEFFSTRLPLLGKHYQVELNLTSNPSPGAVRATEETTVREKWFDPAGIEDLREHTQLISNDTSMGTGFAPEHPTERFVRELTASLSSDMGMRRFWPWCGTDVKVMCVSHNRQLDVVCAVPQISGFTASRVEYQANLKTVRQFVEEQAASAFPGWEVHVRINNRDIPDKDELYLTVTGSSIESGDEGVVGRGNRHTGLISPTRPINLEGVSGKNPVYHVGKLYNLAAQDIAHHLHASTGARIEVFLVSATGQELTKPWRIHIRSDGNPDTTGAEQLVRERLRAIPELTNRLIAGDIPTA